MVPPGDQDYVMNWSMTELSPCYVFKAQDIAGIMHALAPARAWGLSVIPHGAGHSYTDAALNTRGIIIDVTDMNRILSWDPEHGIMQVEPGVTMRDLVRIALPDHWWPTVTPSTADATIGGCVAMNVNGKNAWKYGSFGEHILSLAVLLANGQVHTISPENDPQFFRAVVGSAGLFRHHHLYYAAITTYSFWKCRCTYAASRFHWRDLDDIAGRTVGRLPGSLGGWLRTWTPFGARDRHLCNVSRAEGRTPARDVPTLRTPEPNHAAAKG